MLRAQIQVTNDQGVMHRYDGTGALFIAFEQHFDLSIMELGESPRLEHIWWLGYEAARRMNQHDGLTFAQWCDVTQTVDFEADDDPLVEEATPTG